MTSNFNVKFADQNHDDVFDFLKIAYLFEIYLLHNSFYFSGIKYSSTEMFISLYVLVFKI